MHRSATNNRIGSTRMLDSRFHRINPATQIPTQQAINMSDVVFSSAWFQTLRLFGRENNWHLMSPTNLIPSALEYLITGASRANVWTTSEQYWVSSSRFSSELRGRKTSALSPNVTHTQWSTFNGPVRKLPNTAEQLSWGVVLCATWWRGA